MRNAAAPAIWYAQVVVPSTSMAAGMTRAMSAQVITWTGLTMPEAASADPPAVEMSRIREGDTVACPSADPFSRGPHQST